MKTQLKGLLIGALMVTGMTANAQWFGGLPTNNVISPTNAMLMWLEPKTNAPHYQVRFSTFQSWLENYFPTFSMINASNYVDQSEFNSLLVASNYLRQVTSANGTFTPLLQSSNPAVVKTISGGANVTITDQGGTNLQISASGGAAGDSVLVDGANTVDPNFDDGGQVNFQYTAGTIIAVIKAGVVGNTNLAAMAQNRFKLRVSAGSGDPEDGTPAQALSVLESGGTDILTATEGNANYVLQANGNSSGHNALGALRTSGPRIDWPSKVPNGTLNVQSTNLYTLETNASFALTLSGTATNGQLMTFYVKNTHATSDITLTNTQTFDVPELGAVTNLINIKSNSLAIFGMRYLTNFVATGQWYLEQWQGFLYSLKQGANITFTTNADGTITIAASAGAAGDSITVDGAATTDPNFDDGGDINFTHSGGNITGAVKAGTITHAKYQNIATDRLLGRDTGGSGSPEELTVSGGVEFTGSGGIQSSAFTGDVTKSAGGTAQTIANDAVSNVKAANMAQNTIKGRVTGSTGDPEDLTPAQALTVLESGGTDLLTSTEGVTLGTSQTITGPKKMRVLSFEILTNSYAGFNVFLDLATNSMQFLIVTNNFTLIPTNMAAGQRVSFTMYNTTGSNITITHTAGIQFYGSGVSNVVVSAKRLKSAWESQDGSITNVSAAFAAQKN